MTQSIRCFAFTGNERRVSPAYEWMSVDWEQGERTGQILEVCNGAKSQQISSA
jgi:hypothetical protein